MEKARKGWVPLFAAAAAAVWWGAGCSRTNGPQAQGSISLSLYVDGSPASEVPAAPVQLAPDSVVVRVYRAGSGARLETSRGAAVNGASQVDLTVTCIAEDAKKVSVELFSGENMLYFGVDESVDVVENENTDVTIDAYDIYVNDVEVSDPLIEPGDPPADIYWNRVPAAESYLLVESASPNFEEHLTQSFLTTDTVMTRNRPPGPWYYAVVPLNTYTTGSLSNIAYAYVVSVDEQQPQIDAMLPKEAVLGDHVTLSGQNLDVPGRVWLGTVTCPVVSASETELVFAVPPDGYTGDVTFENLMNTVDAPEVLVVDRIAYVTRSNTHSQWYTDLVAVENRINSGLAVLPLDEVAEREMRVFDVIIVADDVQTGPSGPGQAEVDAIAGSEAQVLAVGRGGHAFLSRAFPVVGGFDVTHSQQQHIYIPDGSLALFQSPHQIAPSDGTPSEPQVCTQDQPFTGVDISAPPASVTTYAALSSTVHPNSHVLLDVEAAVQLQPSTHNIYWGYEGDPTLLTDVGRDCVTNVIVYLWGMQTAVPAAPARDPR